MSSNYRPRPEYFGSYLWRGTKRIDVEKVVDRYTVMVPSERHLARLSNAPGVTEVYKLTKGIARVITDRQCDDSMDYVRRKLNCVGHHAYKPAKTDGTVFYITDKILVRFPQDADRGHIGKTINDFALAVLREYDDHRTFLLQVTALTGENPIKVANRLEESKYVEWAEPNMVNRFRPAGIPTDEHFTKQWHLQFNNAVQLVKEAPIGVVGAWDLLRDKVDQAKEFGDKKIVVAVIDDGFDLDHPDLKGNIVSPLDFVDGDRDPRPVSGLHPGSAGGDYHGTSCAGVVIARRGSTGVVGVAPECAFMPVRIPMSLDDLALDEVIRTVSKEADIISCSFAPPPVNAVQWRKLSESLHNAATSGGPRGNGCVVCFAAGNFNAPINDPENVKFEWPDEDAAPRTTTGAIVNALAAHPDVIGVAACTSEAKHSEYSNWGPEVSVCAPSDNWEPGRIAQGKLPGLGIFTTDNELVGLGFTLGDQYTALFGGTSAAAPIVAGVAALMLSANPGLTASQVKTILQDTAAKIIDAEKDLKGVCRGDKYQQGRCDWFGNGRVDATKAVARAIELRGTH